VTDLFPVFKALLPSAFTVFDGVVAKNDGTPYGPEELPKPPWLFVRFPAPEVLSRALSRDAHGLIVEGEVLCYHRDASGARALAALTVAALDGARPVLSGWSFGSVTVEDVQGPGQDRDVKFAGGFHPHVVGIDFTFVVSKEAP
jgi:hypothetical protein